MKQKIKNTMEINQKNKCYVGADDSVRPLLKRNTQRGITLVALVITIIVLLILAMVSRKIAIDGGLITKASKATDTHTIGAEKEAIQLGYSEYQIDLAKKGSATLTVEGSSNITQTSDGGWKVTFSETTGNVYTVDGKGEITGPIQKTEDELAMEKYILGEDLKGQSITKIMNSEDGSFKQLNGKDVELMITDTETECWYIKYDDKVYKMKLNTHGTYYDDVENWTTESVRKIYQKNGNEGKKVEYSYDGTDTNKKEWTILYDNGDTLDIISPEVIGNLRLGNKDLEAQGEDDLDKGIYSYNNAIGRINSYTNSLVTNSNKILVRSAGSDYSNPNYRNTTKYTSDNLKNINWKYNGKSVTMNGRLEMGDSNFEQDLIRMDYYKENSKTGNRYWLASRYVEEPSDLNEDYSFDVRTIDSDGSVYYISLVYASMEGSSAETAAPSSDSPSHPAECAVRPIVRVDSSKVTIKE